VKTPEAASGEEGRFLYFQEYCAGVFGLGSSYHVCLLISLSSPPFFFSVHHVSLHPPQAAGLPSPPQQAISDEAARRLHPTEMSSWPSISPLYLTSFLPLSCNPSFLILTPYFILHLLANPVDSTPSLFRSVFSSYSSIPFRTVFEDAPRIPEDFNVIWDS